MYTSEDIMNAFSILKETCYGRSYNAGWHTNLETGEPFNERDRMPERLMLIISEAVEGFEAHRKGGLKDDKLPHRDGVRCEIIDTIIRSFDTLGALDVQDELPGESEIVMWEKLEYNANREDHKIENRLKEGGKKI